jgi:hypothetical protein
VDLPTKPSGAGSHREAADAVFDAILALTDYRVAVCYGRDRSRDSRERQHMGELRERFVRALDAYTQSLGASTPARANADKRRTNRAQLVELLGDMFNAALFPPGDAPNEGARAALDRRRESFIYYMLKVLREVVRAIRAGDVDANQ